MAGRMRPLWLVVGISMLTFCAGAQQTQTDPDNRCTINGVVLSATTGEPLKKAIVTAYPIGGVVPGHANRQRLVIGVLGSMRSAVNAGDGELHRRSAHTDIAGRFTIQDLSPGAYQLMAYKAGYSAQAPGGPNASGPAKRLTLAAGQHLNDLALRLTPLGAISGHVYDEDGDPLGNTNVEVLRYAYINGHRQLSPASAAMTNERGEYRVGNLESGKYYLGATYSLVMPDDSAKQSYVPLYYDGARDPGTATPIEVPAGQEVSGIDLNLVPVPGVSVRGRVVNPAVSAPAPNTNVSLARAETGWVSHQRAFAQANSRGEFELRAVPPGSYVLVAQSFNNNKQSVGREPIEVGNTDLDDVTVVVGTSLELKGRVRVEGHARLDSGNLYVNLLPRDQLQMGSGGGKVEPDGSFVLPNVWPGAYTINLCCPPPDFYLKAARLGDSEVLDAGLTVRSTSDGDSLELVLSPAGGHIEGRVLRDGEAYGGATVVLIPDPSRRNQPRLYLSAMTGNDGQFALGSIPPGDYQLFAWENVDAGAYQDPDFLRAYENLGQAVGVKQNDKLNRTLELIRKGEPAR